MRLQTYLTPEEKSGSFLRELWIEIGPACHLACNFCFNSAGRKCQFAFKQMEHEEYARVIEQFAKLGGKIVGVPGFGEPFFGPNLDLTRFIIEHAISLGMRCHIFTAGDILSEELILWLKDKPVSLGVKFNHFDPAVQDAIVGSLGYTQRREKVLELLRKHDFFGENHTETTRLSFVTSVLPENFEVLPEIYRYCRRNGILPDIDMLLPTGRATDQPLDYQIMSERAFSVLKRIDEEEFGIVWESDSPTYAGDCCERCFHHVYIDFRGRVSPCLGANKKEVFIGDVSESLEKLWNSGLMRNVRSRNYNGRCTECVNFRDGKCNSCLGRFAIIKGNLVETIGCWNFK